MKHIEFLSHPRTLAVVGASINSSKPGYFVPKFLQERGYKIIPINPMVDEILGEPTLSSLDELHEPIDGILIYRLQEIAEQVVLKAISMNIPVIWLPEGITSVIAKKAAIKNGALFFEDLCPKKEIERLEIIVKI